jgi:glycosyltransferase involved in cell wall biosynthesis
MGLSGMFKICFVKTGKAFLPELYAYRKFLQKKGAVVYVVEDILEAKKLDVDIYYRFGGVLSTRIKKNTPEIHEYNSCSTGRFPRLKNLVKSLFSTIPAGRVFLNKRVESEFNFFCKRPTLLRDMGAGDSFFKIRDAETKKIYDVAYVGSISEREGVLDTLLNLAGLNIKLVVAGTVNKKDLNLLSVEDNITFLGRIDNDSVCDVLASARFGLNYCPITYPYHFQTSTKVIEYLAAGIPVISNKYSWIDEHSTENGYIYLPLESITSRDDLMDAYLAFKGKSNFCDVAKSWEGILVDIDFWGFISSIHKTSLLSMTGCLKSRRHK